MDGFPRIPDGRAKWYVWSSFVISHHQHQLHSRNYDYFFLWGIPATERSGKSHHYCVRMLLISLTHSPPHLWGNAEFNSQNVKFILAPKPDCNYNSWVCWFPKTKLLLRYGCGKRVWCYGKHVLCLWAVLSCVGISWTERKCHTLIRVRALYRAATFRSSKRAWSRDMCIMYNVSVSTFLMLRVL